MTVLARVLAKGTVLYRYCTGTGTSTRYRYGVTLLLTFDCCLSSRQQASGEAERTSSEGSWRGDH